MHQLRNLLSLLLLAAFPFLSFGQKCDATLCGTVLDADTKEPIAFAEVFIQETAKGVTTDDAGKFHFHNLCEGNYTVESRHIGCPHVAKEIVIQGNVEVDFRLRHGLDLDEIVVKAQSLSPVSTQSEQQLIGLKLDALKGQTLGDALANLQGVSTLNTGSSISKPVIRGLHSNRVLLLTDGVRQEGQQWGLDHGPEIDPYLAGEMTVVMGANSVRYGADALGGVILIKPKPLRDMVGIGGEVNLAGFSNGQTGVISAAIDGKLKGNLPLSGRLQGTFKRGGNTQTPDYFLENTGVKEQNFSGTVGLKKGAFDSEIFYSLFQTDLGIFEGAHIGNTTDLQTAIGRGRPIDDGKFTYEIGRPMQRVAHHLLKAKTAWSMPDFGKLSLQYARQFNRRQEFDAHKSFGTLPEGLENPEIEFEITTHTLDMTLEHKPIQHFSGSFGAQLMQQKNTTDRGGLIPNYDTQTFGVFWIERWRKYPFPLELEAGLRYDIRQMNIKNQGNEIIDKQLSFNNLSGTFGAIYKLPKYLNIKLHFGTAWRAPSVSELYSDGVHHGSASYELGNVNLISERAFSTNLAFDLTIPNQHSETGFRASLALYQNEVNDFIYLQPQAQPVLTIRGAFPAFEYQQTDAQLRGLDWTANWQFSPQWELESGASILRAIDKKTEEFLIFMPADNFSHSLTWFPAFLKNQAAKTTNLKMTMRNVLQQTHLPEGQDFAAAPNGYTLFDVAFSTSFNINNQPLNIGLAVQNLFNTAYRSYLNRLRYFSDEMGRNISVRLKYSF
ncbi:MAG: iron complex outermembrane receptor protein [Paraglaciecola sp.]|jgi:iron complex outermembrane receptor protein